MAKTYNVGRLSVEMVADTVQYVQKLKEAENKTATTQKKIRNETKKTGREMDDAEKKTKKYSEAMSKMGQAAALVSGPMGGVASRIGALNSLMGGAGGFVFGVGAVVVAAGAAAFAIQDMGVNLNNQRKELEVYANIAGITAREMQNITAATSRVGVSQEKFGDIIKDVRDKLGDFVATGAGPFNDVFAVLGGNLKYTAQELQRMSGPDALQAIAHAMEEANIPMGEQIFIMESLASDSSKLLSLYADGSSEMNRFAYESELTTRALGEQQAIYGELERSLELAKQNTADYITEAAAPLAETVNELVKGFNIWITSMDKSTEASRLLRMAELKEEIDTLNRALDVADTKWGRFRIVMTGLSTDTKVLRTELSKLSKEYDSLLKVGVDAQMPGTNTNEGPVNTNPFEMGPEIPPVLDIYRKHNLKMEEEQKKENERRLKEDEQNAKRASRDADKRNREALRKEQEKNKAFFAEQKRANEEMESLREAHFTMLSEKFDLEQMALSGPVLPENQSMAQAQLDNQLSMLELNLNRELELLRQNYAHKTELEEQYQAAVAATKNQYYAETLEAHKAAVNAEMQLYTQLGNTLGNHLSALAGASDEEKEELTKQFLMQQALAAGQATLEYYAAMAAHESAAAAMGPAGAAYLASQSAIATANWQKNLAGIAAISVAGGVAGQFHGGVDSLPQSMDNKSFILKAGERVIQPRANAKLESFLDGNTNGGGGVEINAPMTINGNVTDKKWFSEQLVHHRNTIAAAYQKVQKERPRRR